MACPSAMDTRAVHFCSAQETLPEELRYTERDGSECGAGMPSEEQEAQEELWPDLKSSRRRASRQRQSSPRPAAEFFRDYSVDEMIGEGRYGSVWRCTDLSTGEELACKQVEKRESRRLLLRELECHRKAQGHPNILELLGAYESDRYLYFVTELCTGGDLFDDICSEETMSEEESKGLFQQLVEAVHHCHAQGIIHRDIKPENVLVQICPTTGQKRVKLADFGLSARLERGEKTIGHVGSDPYEAPEVLANMPYDFSADVFSLGVVLFGMLSGTWPSFSQDRVFDALGDFSWPGWRRISWGAKNLIDLMLSVDPRMRPTTSEILNSVWLSPAPLAPAPPLSTCNVGEEEEEVAHDDQPAELQGETVKAQADTQPDVTSDWQNKCISRTLSHSDYASDGEEDKQPKARLCMNAEIKKRLAAFINVQGSSTDNSWAGSGFSSPSTNSQCSDSPLVSLCPREHFSDV